MTPSVACVWEILLLYVLFRDDSIGTLVERSALIGDVGGARYILACVLA